MLHYTHVLNLEQVYADIDNCHMTQIKCLLFYKMFENRQRKWIAYWLKRKDLLFTAIVSPYRYSSF